jgi:hypothetical protein
VVADERKAIEAILTEPPARLHQVEAPLALFDKQGGLNRSSRALDDVYSYLEAEARRGNVVTGKTLVDRYEGIPYGWDSNIARLCAAALFRSGALLLTLDKKDYRDPRDAEAQRTFLDSRRFERAELHLESDLELSVEERMRAREQMYALFGARPEETPAALAETLQQQLHERLTTLRELAEWVRLTGFPAPAAYAPAAESFERLVEERRPNTCVRQFLARLEEVSEQVRVADRLQAFCSSPRREEYERAQAMIDALRAALAEGLATEPMRTAVTEYDGRSRDRELLDRWPEVHGLLLGALSDLKALYSRLHEEADGAYRAVAERIEHDANARGVGSDGGLAELVAAASQHVCGQISGWTPESGYRCGQCRRDLATLINAPLAAQRLEDRLLGQLEDRLLSRATPSDDGPVAVARRVRTIRLAEAIATRRIRGLADWEAARDQLDKVVREALADGDEVELR